jgi:hypothetical protein
VGQEEFQAEQDWGLVSRRIASGELGQQRQGTTDKWRLIGREPEINATQVACLARPGHPPAWDRLPNQTLVMNVGWHDGEWSTRVQPARFSEGLRIWWHSAEVEVHHEARRWE